MTRSRVKAQGAAGLALTQRAANVVGGGQSAYRRARLLDVFITC
jgi:hypothetical protein